MFPNLDLFISSSVYSLEKQATRFVRIGTYLPIHTASCPRKW